MDDGLEINRGVKVNTVLRVFYIRHPAYHARLGGKSVWCSQKEFLNYLTIDFPRKYMITSVSVNVIETYQGKIYLLTQMLNKWIDVYTSTDKVINVDQDLIGKPEYEGYKPRKCERGEQRGHKVSMFSQLVKWSS